VRIDWPGSGTVSECQASKETVCPARADEFIPEVKSWRLLVEGNGGPVPDRGKNTIQIAKDISGDKVRALCLRGSEAGGQDAGATLAISAGTLAGAREQSRRSWGFDFAMHSRAFCGERGEDASKAEIVSCCAAKAKNLRVVESLSDEFLAVGVTDGDGRL